MRRIAPLRYVHSGPAESFSMPLLLFSDADQAFNFDQRDA